LRGLSLYVGTGSTGFGSPPVTTGGLMVTDGLATRDRYIDHDKKNRPRYVGPDIDRFS
jgi:hypothetical protein